ncbi:MAG: O-methyltransferase [Nitrosomonas sp.]|nr:MAG: O-methyltransferase [Nitrosomonas sp.]
MCADRSIINNAVNNANRITPVDPAIEAYMRGLVASTDHPVLADMEEYAHMHRFPIVNRLAGVFLQTQASMVNAKRVFEFGSGYGYSAYWFARAVGEDGSVICSDADPANRERAAQYLTQADLWSRVQFNVGLAQEVFAQTGGLFDICYNDVDKGDYPQIWLMAKDRIRSGGLYIADNVLWQGRVTMPAYQDPAMGSTAAIVEHNRLIFNDSDFDAFINPTRDGLIVARRK